MMRPRNRCFAVALLLLMSCTQQAGARPFVAYSMTEAQRRLTTHDAADPVLGQLGRMTRIAGMVFDPTRKDVIIVGQTNPGEDPVTLDDFIVALRSRLVHESWPLVSIDKTTETSATGRQQVRFEGGIADTSLGKALLEADITLKKLALGAMPTDIWGVRSYFSMLVEQARREAGDRTVTTRFWFYPLSPVLAQREDVFVIKSLKVGVRTQVLDAAAAGEQTAGAVQHTDEVGEAFAAMLTARYEDLCASHPEIRRLKTLFDLVGLAEGCRSLSSKADFHYWLRDYEIATVKTPTDHPLLRQEEQWEANGASRVLETNGGIELRALLSSLRDGDVTALREVVLRARPEGHPLVWQVPIEGWHIPDYPESMVGSDAEAEGGHSPSWELPRREMGTVISSRSKMVEAADLTTVVPASSFSPAHVEQPRLAVSPQLYPQQQSSRVGGVMLQGAANVSGSDRAQVNLNNGGFSLVVDGQNAQLSPEAFRRFVTALWAVYYGDRDPGISIDPIAPGVNKHMVRYIGKVINSDLGRVMREADYLMKQWAVGTGRPDIPGFQNPDDIAAQNRVMYVGAASRFWFVPQDMKFRRGGDLLLFENGRMVVKTEFMFNNDSMQADPANERFAQFFTDHYIEIAQRYPVYQELFEYAKMVSLAKYLKESGVPLFWFLMANKDLVLTEDSPGTVDALAKGSDYFKNVSIEGGVDLATQGRYVYDAEAMKAVAEAVSKSRPTAATETSLGTPGISRSIPDRFSFDLAGQAYSVLPQHSLTGGKDRRGIRYQTDIAFRDTGFCLTEQALEELDARITRMMMAEEASRSTQPAEGTSEEETRRWCQGLYDRAVGQARPIREGLGKLKGRKYSSEQEFARAIDQVLPAREGADWITPMVVKQGYYNTLLELVRYFNPGQRGCGDFGEGWHLMIPYRIRPADPAKKQFNSVLVPERMTVQNLVSGDYETLTFNTDRYSVAGYVPDSVGRSQVVGLFIMSDGSFRLADKLGNEFWFDPAGRLIDMGFSEQYRTHFEYADDFTDQFDQPPYRVEQASEERAEFRGVSLPKTMVVVDAVHDTRETMVFDPTGEILGYVPRNQTKTRFQILAVLSNLSFRLLDKGGNEIAFGRDGKFEGMSLSTDAPVVKSMGFGPYKVDFGYSMAPSGSPLVARARLSKQDVPGTLYAVRYEYDDENRLCRVQEQDVRVAMNR